MAVPSAPSGGTIPLTEYRRDVPPGWQPGDSGYSLRAYLEKLRMWYRISSLEDYPLMKFGTQPRTSCCRSTFLAECNIW